MATGGGAKSGRRAGGIPGTAEVPGSEREPTSEPSPVLRPALRPFNVQDKVGRVRGVGGGRGPAREGARPPDAADPRGALSHAANSRPPSSKDV